jgi:hypothetical protein
LIVSQIGRCPAVPKWRTAVRSADNRFDRSDNFFVDVALEYRSFGVASGNGDIGKE